MEQGIRLKRVGLAATALLASSLAGGAAQAQTANAGQTCGGLVCDLGLFGLGRAADSAPAVPPAQLDRPVKSVPVAAAPPAPVPAAVHARSAGRIKRHASAQAARTQPRAAPVARQIVPEASTFARAGDAAMSAVPPPARAPIASEPVVLANPYSSGTPAPNLFQPVDPFYHGE